MTKQQVAYNRYLSNYKEWKHCTEMFVYQNQYAGRGVEGHMRKSSHSPLPNKISYYNNNRISYYKISYNTSL